MSGLLLAVRWVQGENEDPKPVKLVGSKFLPNLLGHDAVAFRRKIRTRLSAPSAPFVRAELRHIRQQGTHWWRWLFKYLFRPSFRKQQEEEAHHPADDSYPQFRMVGLIA